MHRQDAVIHPKSKVKADDQLQRVASRRINYLPTIQSMANIVVSIAFFLFALVYYSEVEEWSLQDCVYFLTVTVSTIGYGDRHPTTDQSRIFTILVILVSLVSIFSIRNTFVDALLKLAEEHTTKIADPDLSPYKYWKKCTPPLLMVLTLVIVCSITLWLLEDWTYIQALYFSVVTVTTIGYGDLRLERKESKIFLVFFIPISLCASTAVLRRIALINMEVQADRRELERLSSQPNFRSLRDRRRDGDGVDKLEFLIAMLVQNNICDQENDIDPWLKRFDELDKDGSGRLSRAAIAVLEREESERVALLQEMQNTGSRQGWSLAFARNRFQSSRIKIV